MFLLNGFTTVIISTSSSNSNKVFQISVFILKPKRTCATETYFSWSVQQMKKSVHYLVLANTLDTKTRTVSHIDSFKALLLMRSARKCATVIYRYFNCRKSTIVTLKLLLLLLLILLLLIILLLLFDSGQQQ